METLIDFTWEPRDLGAEVMTEAVFVRVSLCVSLMQPNTCKSKQNQNLEEFAFQQVTFEPNTTQKNNCLFSEQKNQVLEQQTKKLELQFLLLPCWWNKRLTTAPKMGISILANVTAVTSNIANKKNANEAIRCLCNYSSKFLLKNLS